MQFWHKSPFEVNVNKVVIMILQGSVVTQTVLGGIAILYLSECVLTDPKLAEFRGLGIWRPHTTDTDKLSKTWKVLQEEDEHRALSNADTKYDALTDIWAPKTTQNEFKWQHNYCKQRDVRHFRIALKPIHTVAEKYDNLSPKTATVAEKWDCRRKMWQSPNFAVVSPFSATVALFSDSLTFLWESLFCDSVDTALHGQVIHGPRYRWLISYTTPLSDGTPRTFACTLYF